MKKSAFIRFDPNWVKWSIILSIAYWLWKGLLVGVGGMEIGFFMLCMALIFVSSQTRKLFVCFSPFLMYVFLYNSLKILHHYNPFPIHNQALYDYEVQFFGVNVDGEMISLCEFFNLHIHPFFDVISGAFYITWAPFPILFGLLLFFKKERQLLFNFWSCFLIVNLFGFLIYIILPAAPPWYYLKYGADIILDLGGEPAGLARFDHLIGLDLYKNMYSQGTNTFGALPSMHAAFPMVLSYYSLKYGNKLLSTLFLISMIAIWFGAIYSNHHYFIDVLMGICCGIIGIFLTEWLVNGKFASTRYPLIINYIS